MYGLDKEIDLDFLVDCELHQLCFGLAQIIFKFDSGVEFLIEGDLEFQSQNRSDFYFINSIHEAASCITVLLGEEVTGFINDGSGDLKLQFSNGCQLILKDSNESGESYSIISDDQEIIV